MADRNWEKLGSTQVYSDERLQVVVDDVVTPSGDQQTYTVLFMNDAVVILAVDTDGGMYFIKEHRYPINATSLQLPGGVTDIARNSKHEAQLKLQQETGIIAKEWELTQVLHTLDSRSASKTYVYLATNLDVSKSGVKKAKSNSAISEVVHLTADEVKKALRKGNITDMTTAAALAAYWVRQK